MANTVLVTVGSFVGVLLGGAISLVTQRSVERSTSRRHVASIMEGRRGERLAHLITFLETQQEAERVATAKHQHGADSDALVERIEALLDQLWVRLRAVQLLCPDEVGMAARKLAGQTHKVLREGPDDQSVTAILRPYRARLIALSKADLERV